MSGQSSVEERSGRRRRRLGPYRAALKLTAPLLPITAVVITALTYIILGRQSDTVGVLGGLPVNWGVIASVVGLFLAFTIWVTVSFVTQKRATAKESSPPNYHQITEALDSLRYKLDCVCPDGHPTRAVNNGVHMVSKLEACAEAKGQIDKIERKLENTDTAWVTGAGYIELWHRIHRAQEVMIKLVPISEVAEGAMRDDERLRDANIANRKHLLERLRAAVAVLDTPEANGALRYLPECKEYNNMGSLGALDGGGAKANGDAGPSGAEATGTGPRTVTEVGSRIKGVRAVREKLYPVAIAILVETRYEINRFRDNSWEGIVNARNHLLDTSMNLGLMTYGLLVFTLITTPEPRAILWAAIYFLIGAVTALFARARIEWSTASAVDDFGLTRARLLHLPWLAGLAAVGGVLVTAVLGPELVPASGGETAPALAEIFSGENASLLLVAAVFGLTPDLIIRRLEQQTDKYKADLESTQSTQSTESGIRNEGGAKNPQ